LANAGRNCRSGNGNEIACNHFSKIVNGIFRNLKLARSEKILATGEKDNNKQQQAKFWGGSEGSDIWPFTKCALSISRAAGLLMNLRLKAASNGQKVLPTYRSMGDVCFFPSAPQKEIECRLMPQKGPRVWLSWPDENFTSRIIINLNGSSVGFLGLWASGVLK